MSPTSQREYMMQIEELREQLAAVTAELDQYMRNCLHLTVELTDCQQGKLLNEAIAERDELTVFQGMFNDMLLVEVELRKQLAACQQERDDYRAAIEICKTEMQGDKWDALYIDTVLAKYAHTDHPLRHYDRTCPACNTEDKP